MLKLPVVLTHAVATEFFPMMEKDVRSLPKDVAVDASDLQQFDSSALAILLECRRQALAAGKNFSVQGAPERLLQLAEVYGVSALIVAAASSPQAVTA